ncbi:MAG: hypothetical protein ACOYOA_12495 [Saprospiraceae bacterium]
MKKVFFLFMLLSSLQSFAQCTLSFAEPTITGSKFRFSIKMSANRTFNIGPNNLRFNYPVENLSNPRIVFDAFPALVFGETTLMGSNMQTGIISVNTAYYGKSELRGLPINATGVDLVTLEFDIIKGAAQVEFDWRIDKNPKTAIVTDDKSIVVVEEAKPLSISLPETATINKDAEKSKN